MRVALQPRSTQSDSSPAWNRPCHNPAAFSSSFIATVNRAESAQKLRKTFDALGELGKRVEVRQSADNVQSVRESDVVLLWSVSALSSLALPGP